MTAMSMKRVIALIDMDCFYVQCEQRLSPNLWSHPCAVAQYNNWKGGGLIAVNYEARKFDVKRGMRGDEAIQLCPDLHIFSVPEMRGKAELSRYRAASVDVFNAIIEFTTPLNGVIVEKASIDEAFIDLTQEIENRLLCVPNHDISDTKLELNNENLDEWLKRLGNEDLEDNEDDIRLAIGADIVKQIRNHIFEKTQFKCSAGISHNKMLAKISCGLNKPNCQTILPNVGIQNMFERIDINSIRNLGGKLGNQVKKTFAIKTMHELNGIEFIDLCKHFERSTAKWLNDLSNGIDNEPVSDRQVSKSLGCGKNFPGKNALKNINDIKYWTRQLCEELVERMTIDKLTNKRTAKLLTVGFTILNKERSSKSLSIETYCDANKLADYVIKEVFLKNKIEPIVSLMIAASKFCDDSDNPLNNNTKLETFFFKINKNETSNNSDIELIEAKQSNEFKSKKLRPNFSNKSIIDYMGNDVKKVDNNPEKNSDIKIENDQISENIDTYDVFEDIDDFEIYTRKTKSGKRGFFYRKMVEFEEQLLKLNHE